MHEKPNLIDIESKNIAISPKEGIDELRELYVRWSSGIARYSLQASYAIIAANWAVHKKANLILSNKYAVFSIALCIVFICVNILLTGIITELLRIRVDKAAENPDWWAKECKKQVGTHYPYTFATNFLGILLRMIKILSPILAGIFFLLSLK